MLSAGEYLLEKQLIVKKNVELRGVLDSWQHSKFILSYAVKKRVKGTVVYIDYGKNDLEDATVILEEKAGLTGLFFHYPNQEYSVETKEVRNKYGWLIRLKGDASYVKHVTVVNPWRFIDVKSYNPKDTYIGYCTGAPLETGIYVGESMNCMIDNVHFNCWYWNTVFFSNKPSKVDKKTRYKKELDNWMKKNTYAFVFSGSKKLKVYGSFILCSKQAYSLLPGKKTGIGPDGIVVNSGNDWSKYGLYAEANNGLTFLNTHFIDVVTYDDNKNISCIFTGPQLNSKINIYNVSVWGPSPALLDMNGQEVTGINIFNLSYQLYKMDQENKINGGTVRLVNTVRSIPKLPIRFTLDRQASLEMLSSSFIEKIEIIEK